MVYSAPDSDVTINMDTKSMTSQWCLGPPGLQLVFDEEQPKEATPLRLILKKAKVLDYRKVPATMFDILTYYRAYMMSAAKHLSIWVRYQKFNQVVHQQVFYGFGGGLAVFFIHMFLGVYVPKQHFFIAQMAPLLSGIKVIYIIVGIFELTRFVDICLIYLDFLVIGVFSKSPWSRCDHFRTVNYTGYSGVSFIVKCVSTKDFYKEMKNKTSLTFAYGDGFSCFYANGTYCWQVPQILFAHSREVYVSEGTKMCAIYLFVLWGIAAINNKSMFKKHIWRSLNVLQFSLITLHVIVICHLNFFVSPSYHRTNVKPSVISALHFNYDVKKWENLQNDVSVFVQVPPVIHVLTARYSKKPKPSRDSAVLLLTNAIYFMFSVYVAHKVICYCECVMGWELNTVTDSFFLNPILYFWFIYFERFPMGMFYTLFYILLALLHEVLALIITFQCLVEAVSMEFMYSWLRRWQIVMCITIFGFIFNIYIYKERMILHVYSRCVILLLEIVGLYLLYPLRRFLDDVAFVYGVRPSYLRYICMVIFPIAVAIKSHFSYQLYLEGHIYFRHIVWISGALFLFLAVPFITGMCYTIRQNCILKKRKAQIFCPNASWGPENFVFRQIRKLFDSRKYIASQSPRVLSRYLMQNAEPESYKLDVDYASCHQRPMRPLKHKDN